MSDAELFEALRADNEALRELLLRMRPLLHAQWRDEIDAALSRKELSVKKVRTWAAPWDEPRWQDRFGEDK